MQEEDQRTQGLMFEKQKLHERRLEIRKQLDKEKESMMKKFNEAKKNLEVSESDRPKEKKFRVSRRRSRKAPQSCSRQSTGFSPHPNTLSPVNQATREKMKKEAKKILASIKKKNGKAIAKLDKDEEDREAERQELLLTVSNHLERKRLEKIFEIERNKINEKRTVLENKLKEDFGKANGYYADVE